MTVAKWNAKPKSQRKSCELCRKLTSPESFAPGAQVRISEVGDCEKCEVMLAQPSEDNEPIMTLYDLLPSNFDGFSGYRIITLRDVLGLFDLFGVSSELREDYYQRLMFFHSQLVENSEAKRASKES